MGSVDDLVNSHIDRWLFCIQIIAAPNTIRVFVSQITELVYTSENCQ